MKYLLLLLLINPAQAFMTYEFSDLGWMPSEKEWAFSLAINKSDKEQYLSGSSTRREDSKLTAFQILYGLRNRLTIGLLGVYLRSTETEDGTLNLPVKNRGGGDPTFVAIYRLASQYPRYFSLDLGLSYTYALDDIKSGQSDPFDTTQGTAHTGGDSYDISISLNHNTLNSEFNITFNTLISDEKHGQILMVPPPVMEVRVGSTVDYSLSYTYKKNIHRLWKFLFNYTHIWQDDKKFNLPGIEETDTSSQIKSFSLALRYVPYGNSFYEIKIIEDSSNGLEMYSNGVFSNRVENDNTKAIELSYSYLF